MSWNHLVLAAASRSTNLFGDLLPWLIVLIAIVLVGAGIVYYLRKSLHEDTPGTSDGFTLYDLRQLHDSGQLSDIEYENARSAMIKSVNPLRSENETAAERGKPGNDQNNAKNDK